MRRGWRVAVMVVASTGVSRAATVVQCKTLARHGQRVEAKRCYGALAGSADAALRAEGLWGLGEYVAANVAFRAAAALPGSSAETRVRWGMLLHERFNNSEAAGLFGEALAKDPANARAYLGLAGVSADGFDGKAVAYAAKAISLDPKLIEAHELMANLELENGDTEAALREADVALAIAPDALDAMAVHAAVEQLADRSPAVWYGKIRTVNATYGKAYEAVARQLEMHYRYEDAIASYRKAVEADPQLWSAHALLGIDLMRMGQETEPLHELELAYNNGYRDAATVNSLRLLDSYKNFTTFREGDTILRLRSGEAELLRPYFEPELKRAIATYERKYGMKLNGPVQVEVYPDHEDFAVRTMGMPGLGALGVTFGQVVAMDSPSGRKPGEFNWDATLWHELSHVFILSATNHRVPRWFTEGLAVHEEGEASAEWSNRATPEVLLAIRDKKLLPVAGIDRGFVMPEYPSQVIVSYFQAGTICDYIQGRWGAAKLMEMVYSFAASKTTAEVVQHDLGMAPEKFDAEYLAWLTARYGKQAAGFDAWRTGLKGLVALARTKQWDEVLRAGVRVRDLYPEYVGDANAYAFLADGHEAQGDKAAAAGDLAAYKKMGGEDPGTLKRLAALDEELGDTKGAAEVLDRINAVYPVGDEALHQHLGALWLAQKNYPGAIREFTAVLAMHPLDKAGAEFHLAEAYLAAGERDHAEERVLLSLEAAPGYKPAQKMLLELEHSTK